MDTENLFKRVIFVFALLILFLVLFIPHDHAKMPMHVDSWIHLTIAKEIADQRQITDTCPYQFMQTCPYPHGFHVFAALFTNVTGFPLHLLELLLVPLLFVLLGLLNFCIAKELFESEEVAFLSMIFTLLVIGNMTIIGPLYFVPQTLAFILLWTAWLLFLKKQYLLACLPFGLIIVTHRSTLVLGFFLLCANLLPLLLEKRSIKQSVMMSLIPLTILGLIALAYRKTIIPVLQYALISPIETPQQFLPQMVSWTFVVIALLGLIAMALLRNKVRWMFLPLLGFLIIDYVLFHLTGYGYGILYRRLVFFIIMFLPFMVGRGVMLLQETAEHLFKREWIKTYQIVLFVLMIVLIPKALSINLSTMPSSVWVTPQEHQLWSAFAVQHEGAELLTDHLEAYALPYYGLQPLQTSPMHLAGGYNDFLRFPYYYQNETQLIPFFKQHPHAYLYYSTPFNSSAFEPVMNRSSLGIYRFKEGSS
ncbi:hypothetical protein HZB02_03990 [Candidatus Woesearchaeota archaeon]|nr:hypothetical protein [Candidatus Woesearchaeota archaeon]